MTSQDIGDSDNHYSDEEPTLMDWCQDLNTDDFICQSADPPIPEDQWKLKETSSYGKSSCVLPITFFDIQSNIQLLNDCNPLSIQVVDCDKHPWYYKEYSRSYIPGKSVADMEDPRKTLHKPIVKQTGKPPFKCIDLTENTCNSYINNDSDAVQDVAKFNKLVSSENKTPPVSKNTMKKKQHKLPKNVLRDELEKQTACSQMNISKIDLKHNTGLIGLKIKQPIKIINFPESTNKIKTKSIERKTENNEVDECFSTASKALGRLGTIIVPVVINQEQSKHFEKDIPNKTHESRVSSKCPDQITESKSDVKTTKNSQIENILSGSNKSFTDDKLKNDSKEKLTSSTQALDKKTNIQVRIKKVPETANRDKEVLKPGNCAFVNNKEPCRPKENQNNTKFNERASEDTSRSKSPVLPCNKQKLQNEPEKHLHINDKSHVKPKKAFKPAKGSKLGQNNMIFIKDWPKSAYQYKQPPPRKPKTLRDNVKKKSSTNNSNSILNETSSQPTNSNKDTNVSLNNNVHIKQQKRVITIKAVTTPTVNNCIKIIPKPSYECKESSVLNVHANEAQRHEVNKNATPEAVQFKKTNSNVNVHDRNLSSLYQEHFARIHKHRLTPKVSDKPEKIFEPPLPKTRPPVQTVAPNKSLPMHTQASNKPESNKEYPGRIPSVATSQNNGASLLKQPIPVTVPTYCKVNGVTNNFANHPIYYPTNVNGFPMNIGNSNYCYTGWDSRLHFPVPPFMHPPPLFLPPPPLPASLERLQKIITELQNCADKPIEDVKIKKDINLKAKKSMAIPKATKKKSKNTKNTKKMKHSDKSSDLQITQDSSSVEKNKTIPEPIKAPLHMPILIQTANKTEILPVQNKESTITQDKSLKDNVPVKDHTSHNPSKIAILTDIIISPVSKSSAFDSPYNNTIISESNLNGMKTNDRTLDEKNKNAVSSSLPTVDKIDESQTDKSKKRSKPGPLCMKNKTGPFAVNNASSPAELNLPTQTVNSQPKKSYSAPILPIPTFQTMLAHKNELDIPMLKAPSNTNPRPSQHFFTPPINRIPNGKSIEIGSRKRLHFEEKDVSEVKKLKKISLEDYKNRSSGIDKLVDLTYDPSSIPGRKYARKSECSFKSLKSLADVVNHNLEHEL